MVFVFPCIPGSFQSDSSVSYIYCFLDTFWKNTFPQVVAQFYTMFTAVKVHG